MNILETIIAVLLIIMLVMTAVQEPKLTFEFTKAYVTSGIKAVKFINNQVHKEDNDKLQSNNKQQNP